MPAWPQTRPFGSSASFGKASGGLRRHAGDPFTRVGASHKKGAAGVAEDAWQQGAWYAGPEASESEDSGSGDVGGPEASARSTTSFAACCHGDVDSHLFTMRTEAERHSGTPQWNGGGGSAKDGLGGGGAGGTAGRSGEVQASVPPVIAARLSGTLGADVLHVQVHVQELEVGLYVCAYRA